MKDIEKEKIKNIISKCLDKNSLKLDDALNAFGKILKVVCKESK